MIRRVLANRPTFRNTTFEPGFNVVLADRTKESTSKDSRNGLGKSTLIEIIHFCLGSKASKKSPLAVDLLKDWDFSVELETNGQIEMVTRSAGDPKRIRVEGTWDLPFQPSKKKGEIVPAYTEDEWRTLLGHLWYGLPLESPAYTPTFRALISYAIRRGAAGYHSPFFQSKEQQPWDSQLHMAFLLGLHWEDAAKLQRLKVRESGLKDLRSAVKSGVVKGFSGERPELVARRARLAKEMQKLSEELAQYRVLDNYAQIQEEADSLTSDLHELTESLFLNKRMLVSYRESRAEDPDSLAGTVGQLYKELGVNLPELVHRRIEEVQAFHEAMIRNRTEFLSTEVSRLEAEIHSLSARQSLVSERRASLMAILQGHGALEEFNQLQNRLASQREELRKLDNLIENIDSLKDGNQSLAIDRTTAIQVGSQDFKERRDLCDRAITIFNEYSQYLYEAPGNLLIDFEQKGFKFDIEIERSGSSGIEYMKVFCFDLMLARLWAEKQCSPGLLIHDSLIFDPVDERQVARALELAARESKKWGFQYICTMNSDKVPEKEFRDGFSLTPYIRLRLTDRDISGSLLGIRF